MAVGEPLAQVTVLRRGLVQGAHQCFDVGPQPAVLLGVRSP